MSLSPELIAALIASITAVLTALAGWIGKREQRKSGELKQVARDYADLREQMLLSDQWMFDMSRTLRQNGVDIPQPPAGLRTNFGVGGKHRHDRAD